MESLEVKSRNQSNAADSPFGKPDVFKRTPGRRIWGCLANLPSSSVQWAYLFERFPTFTQTFCTREVAEMQRQGLAPWIFSIRRPAAEPAQDVPGDLASQVRYLPEEADLADEFRWLRRCDRLPETLRADEQRLKGARDKARLQEAGWLGTQMKAMGIGHVHTHFAGIAARTAYWLRVHYRIGYSFTAHANDLFCPPDPELALTLADLVRGARFVVTVSDFSAAQMQARFPEAAGKIHRVYNGLDPAAFAPAQPERNAPLIVAVGRYIEKKGFVDLIAACARLRDQQVDFQCQLVGEGPLQAELAAAIGQHGLGAQIVLTGPKTIGEVAALLASARVFVLPCVAQADGGMDNLPTVIAEAMAAGLPVVSTTLAGVPEMVGAGETGLLVRPGDAAALAAALARMLSEPATAARFGRAGRQRAQRLFDVAATGRQFKRLLLANTAIEPGRAARWKDPYLVWLLARRRPLLASGGL
jgi:colanic acid/amylovoran biosynthesis glycosyltransferase